jgi:hypothetical protein
MHTRARTHARYILRCEISQLIADCQEIQNASSHAYSGYGSSIVLFPQRNMEMSLQRFVSFQLYTPLGRLPT